MREVEERSFEEAAGSRINSIFQDVNRFFWNVKKEEILFQRREEGD